MSFSDFELNPQVRRALDLLTKTDQHVFITGRAGTGKSTLLKYFLTQIEHLDYVVLAPTGVAALNVGGETIHRFLRIKPAATRDEVIADAKRAKNGKNAKLYQNLDLLIIDEISMVRADLFDHLDIFLQTVRGKKKQKYPFGGVRVVCFGDLYQLPPVVRFDEHEAFRDYYNSPYFFSSHVFARLRQEALFDNFSFIELEKIYRQSDPHFINFLDHLRQKTLTPAELDTINRRVLEISDLDELDPRFIILTVTKARAQALNLARLRRLDSKDYHFHADTIGHFSQSSSPTDEVLTLKVGARVMLLNNDSQNRWINGSMGEITQISPKTDTILVALDAGGTVEVKPFTWETSRSVFNPRAKRIEREPIGSFSQYPLKLAWAITVHKAQGQTFDKLIIDLERHAFATGQTYVAFSRATCLEGLHLVRPLRFSDIHLDTQIQQFLATLHG